MDPNVLTAIIGMVSGAVVVAISKLFDMAINKPKADADASLSFASAAEKMYTGLQQEVERLNKKNEADDRRAVAQQTQISAMQVTIDDLKASNSRLQTIISIYHAHILRQNDAMTAHGLIPLVMPNLPDEGDEVKKKTPRFQELNEGDGMARAA